MQIYDFPTHSKQMKGKKLKKAITLLIYESKTNPHRMMRYEDSRI